MDAYSIFLPYRLSARLDSIRTAFQSMDADGSGSLDLKELESALQNPEI